MKNFSKEWKKSVNFRQYSYDDFVTEFPDPKNGIYMEKVDGMLGTFIYENGNGFFQTTTGNEIKDIPASEEYISLLKSMDIKECKIPGEMVAKNGTEILPFNISQGIVKTYYKPGHANMIYHYPVDIYSLDNQKMNIRKSLTFLKRFRGGHITQPTMRYGGLEEFRNLYTETSNKSGFDGVVARDINNKNFKVKFNNTVDLVVIGGGHERMRAWEKNQVSYLLSAFIDKNGIFRSSSKVGTGFKESDRKHFYNFLNENHLYKKDGELFLKPMLIVEVKFFRTRLTKTPAYNFLNNEYKLVGYENSVTFSHPSFLRIRKDKKPTKFDTRLEQIPEFRY